MRTAISMIVAATILIVWQMIPGRSWGMSSNLWLVPVILTLQTSFPFFVAGVVAGLIARRRILIHLAIFWAIFWISSIWWLSTHDPMAELITVGDLVKFNIGGIIGSLFGFLAGSLLVDIRSRRADSLLSKREPQAD